jgi:hypothetical protein
MVETSACVCGSIGEDPLRTRLCPECHIYWKGDRQLLSVSKVLRSTWPFKPDFSAAPDHVIDNARHRGIAVDEMVSAYVIGDLKSIPAGTRKDAVELFFKFKRWWDEHKHGEVRSQVILADDAVAGTCDIMDDDTVWDLKSTHDIEPMYPVQLGAYGALHFSTFTKPVKHLGIIHVTKRYPAPKIIKLDVAEVIQDWMLLRDAYFMAVRRTA